MVWFYKADVLVKIPEGAVGFVYQIKNVLNGRSYIGRKTFYFTKRNSKKKRIKVESDWQKYWSSSNALKEDVGKLGEMCFRRVILHICTTKSQMAYLELVEQVKRGVLESNDFYNETIYCRIRKSRHLNVPSKHTQ